jgi:hypothetical protein
MRNLLKNKKKYFDSKLIDFIVYNIITYEQKKIKHR